MVGPSRYRAHLDAYTLPSRLSEPVVLWTILPATFINVRIMPCESIVENRRGTNSVFPIRRYGTKKESQHKKEQHARISYKVTVIFVEFCDWLREIAYRFCTGGGGGCDCTIRQADKLVYVRARYRRVADDADDKMWRRAYQTSDDTKLKHSP